MARTYRYNDYYDEEELRFSSSNNRSSFKNSLRNMAELYNSGNINEIGSKWEEEEEYFTQNS